MPDEKMKYPLLEFEYDKKLYEELLTLNPHPEFMDRVSTVTEDYEHDDFGSLPGDEKNALGHAAGVLWKIQKYGTSFSDEESKTIRTRKRSRTKKPDLLLFVNDLENDFHNYCACIKHGLGNKADLCALTEALLCYGCEDTVWEEVTEWHTAVSENKNFAKSTFLPNFDRLYIRQADRFLFLELNTEEALKFYGLATMLWDHEPDAKETNSDDHFVSFTRQYELYSRILKGASYPYGTSSQPSAFFQLYNRIIHSGISSSSLSEKLSTFAENYPTDAGREGELIFRFVYQMAGCTKPVKRLWVSSMEDAAIREGFANLRPDSDYDALYQSALCRAKADWLVGINATRLFSVLYHKTLTVGRVQTPTLKMLVDRDAKILRFQKEKYYTVGIHSGSLKADSGRIADAETANSLKEKCTGTTTVCTSVKREKKTEQPPKLYCP